MLSRSFSSVLLSTCMVFGIFFGTASLSADPVTTYYTETPQSNMETQGSIKWYTNYDQATEIAQKSGKPLLLYFTGTGWCGWCKKMDSEIFSNATFADGAGERFVFVKIDFPLNQQGAAENSQRNNTLKQQFGVTGYPTVVLLDPSGNFIAKTGYRAGGAREYSNYLMSFINK